MLIQYVSKAKRVGEIALNPNHDKKLSLVADPHLSIEELRSNIGRVYFITVNGEIVKIGGSSCKGGIQGTIGAYLGGFAQGMSPRSYCGWHYMRQHIEAGNKVEFHVIHAPTTKAKIPSMNSEIEVEIAVDFHQIESACVKEYVEIETKYPFLNMQESGQKWRDMSGPSGKLLEGYPGIIETE